MDDFDMDFDNDFGKDDIDVHIIRDMLGFDDMLSDDDLFRFKSKLDHFDSISSNTGLFE
jgi:hypothetical protein